MHYFLRHPEIPEAQGRCYGQTDWPISDAQIAAAIGACVGAIAAHPILCSPLLRCAEVARQLAAFWRQGPPRQDARLAELSFGAWENQPWSAIDRGALTRWAEDIAHFRAPGGESFTELTARVADALRELSVPHVIVTHAGVVRAALHAAGMPIAEAARVPVPYARPLRVDRHGLLELP